MDVKDFPLVPFKPDQEPAAEGPVKTSQLQQDMLQPAFVYKKLDIPDLESKIEEDPQNFEAYLQLGTLYRKERDFKKAEAAFMQAKRLNPQSPYPYLYMGTVQKGNNNLEMAIRWCHQALKVNPGMPEAFYNIACYYSLKQNAVMALEYLEKSFNQGFIDFSWADRDPDLNYLRSRTSWRRIVRAYSWTCSVFGH